MLAVLGLLFLGLGGVSAMAVLGSPSPAVAVPEEFAGEPAPLTEIANIYPYSKDGRPLRDVLPYDQNGHPVQVPYENFDMRLDQPCGSPPPIANSYPLPLRRSDPDEMTGPDPIPSCRAETPTPVPHPGDTASPSPEPSPSETTSASPTG